MSTSMIERDPTVRADVPDGGTESRVEQDQWNGLPCHDEDPELFFAESPTDVELAKQVCAPCPLREACLTAALDRREPWGVWGGELVQQGVVVARKRGPGRPRKDGSSRDGTDLVPLVVAS